MESTGQQQHLLGLKVMRLTKPSLLTSHMVLGEPWDMLGTTLQCEAESDICTQSEYPCFSTSKVLSLPQSFGMIFLGETFSGFVTVHNDSQETVRDVNLKVELLTPSQRVSLLSDCLIPTLDEGGCEDRIISHEVKELGEHSLICSATYTVHTSGEELFLRKFFKFNVAKPLDVKTKFMNVEDDIMLEVQIQNITQNPMFLEIVNFDPSSSFLAQDLNTLHQDEREDNSLTGKEALIFGSNNYLLPRNTRQYLYKISPLVPVRIPEKPVSVTVGKMDIVWRSRFGEKGRIQTGQLKSSVPALPELKITLTESPGTVKLEHAFHVTCHITNTSSHVMRLRSILDRQPGAGILWSGNTGKVHKELPSNSSLELRLTLIPIAPGLQTIGPVTFLDMLSNQKKYHFSRLGQVFVENS